MQISLVTGQKVSTLDPRFIPTSKGSASNLPSDQSNRDVIFLAYGTFDMQSGEELDLLYTRSTDRGATWEYIDADGDIVVTDAGLDGIPGTADDPAVRVAKLSAFDDVHEMEVQGLASPNGTRLFGAWLRETAEVCSSPECGMDSRFGTVDYVDPDADS